MLLLPVKYLLKLDLDFFELKIKNFFQATAGQNQDRPIQDHDHQKKGLKTKTGYMDNITSLHCAIY